MCSKVGHFIFDKNTSRHCDCLTIKMGKKSEPKPKKGDSKKDKREQERNGKDRKDDNKYDKKWKDNGKRNKGKSYRSYDTREEIELAKTLAESNLVIHRMDGDGNCMFRSIADQITGDPEHHEMFREKIMKYIAQHAEHFSLFMEDDENFDVYVERMNQLNEWGGHPELYAASQCFHINITVYQLDNPTYVIQAGTNDSKVPKEIRLSYHGECHYNSVRCGNSSPKALTIEPTASKTDGPKEQLFLFDDDLAVVQSAVPWIDKEKVMAVLQQCKGDVDITIELLCADTEAVTLDETPPPLKKHNETIGDVISRNSGDLPINTTVAAPVATSKDIVATECSALATVSSTTAVVGTHHGENNTPAIVSVEMVSKEKKNRKNGDTKGKPLSKKEQRILDRALAREKARGNGGGNSSATNPSIPAVHTSTTASNNYTIIL